MTKNLKLLICILFFTYIFIPKLSVTGAVHIPSWIRIGLEYKYKNTNKIDIKNNEIVMGYELKGDFIPEVVFQSNTGFCVIPSNAYFIAMNQFLNTYDEAKSLAQDFQRLGFNAFPAGFSSSKWMVYIGEFQSYEEAQIISLSANDITGERFMIKEPSNTRIILRNQNEMITVIEGEEAYPQFEGISAFSDGIIDFGDRQYRGRIEFGRYGGAGITAVNVILLDEYLYSVVPSEMYASWNIEALKAQSVVARNYAVLFMGKHKNSGYDLCDGEHCQTYKGYGAENINSNEAVKATQGELLYYDDEIIEAFYFASSGGYTESSENVWVTPLPYLKAVPDIYEENHQDWTRSFTKEQIETLLINSGKDIGEVLDLQIESYTPGGRVMELKIIGNKGTEILTKETVRTFFKSNGVSLPSRMFEIIKNGNGSSSSSIVVMGDGNITKNMNHSQISVIGEDKKIKTIDLEEDSIYVQGSNGVNEISCIPSTPVSGDFVFKGKGSGHGVGLSQWGAKGMADQGYNYKQILSYYFTGTTVR